MNIFFLLDEVLSSFINFWLVFLNFYYNFIQVVNLWQWIDDGGG